MQFVDTEKWLMQFGCNLKEIKKYILKHTVMLEYFNIKNNDVELIITII